MAISGLAQRSWLLLPGTLCTGAVFDGFLDTLGVSLAHRRTVLPDRPAIEDYRTTFETLPQGTVVCGFSLGAIVAAHHADRMDTPLLILFGLNPYADDPAKAEGRHDLARDVCAQGGAAALRARGVDVHGTQPGAVRGSIYQMADATADLIDAQTQLALTRPGALPALGRARMPVLALTGTQDAAAPPAQGRAAAQAAPHGQFHALDGLGHFALLEDPAACAAAVKQCHDTA